MGVIVNTDPDLWGAIVADVPFVDILNTMLDDSLPLTPGEWPEWGNPIECKQAFAYILQLLAPTIRWWRRIIRRCWSPPA